MTHLDKISGIGKLKGDIRGNKATIKPGEYEVTDYTEDGGAHSNDYKTVEEPIEGLVVAEVYEGGYLYNIAVNNKENETIFLLVPEKSIKSDKTRKA